MATICFFCVICGTALQASSDSPDDLVQCRACARHVPVPRLLNLLSHGREYPPVLPAEVLELSVVFHCTKCQSRLRADARWEGRGMSCPDCGAKALIPRWSDGPLWPPTWKAKRALPKPINLEAATLSAEEIDFLSGQAPRNPGALS